MPTSAPCRPRSARASSVRARLASEDWAALLGAGHRVRVPPGSPLVREGDPPGRVLVVVDGWARVVATIADGRESTVGLRGPGDLVGELASIRRAQRAASVRALTTVDAVRLSSEDMTRVLHRRPAVGLAVMADLADRLVEAGRQLIAREAETTEQRLMGLLCQLVEDAGRQPSASAEIVLELPLSQADLGDLIGASRESVARALCRLRAADVLATQRRRIVVLDLSALSPPA